MLRTNAHAALAKVSMSSRQQKLSITGRSGVFRHAWLAALACLTLMSVLAAQAQTPAPPDVVADVVYGQLGSFTTNVLNNGTGLAPNADVLWTPAGVAVDRDGGVYISDNGNSRILFFPPGSTTATGVYGQHGSFTSNSFTGGAALSAESLLFPEGITLDGDGNLYVADRNNNRVLFYPSGSTIATRVYGQNGSFTTNFTNGGVLPPTANQLFGPFDVAVDSLGNVYIADTNNHRILFFPPGFITPTRVYGQHGAFDTGEPNKNGRSANTFSFPRGLAFDSAGNLYVVDRNNHRVLVFEPDSTTAFRVYGQAGDFATATGGTTATQFAAPDGIAIDRHDNIYIVDSGNHRVLFFPAGSTAATHVYGQDGSFTTALGNKGGLSADSLLAPGAVAMDRTGNLYVADRNNHRVLRYDRAPDTIPPTASLEQVPSANAAGWHHTDVIVQWNWSDDEAGTGIDVEACPESSTSSGEGSPLTISTTCSDLAGNSASASLDVHIDKTPPTIVAAATVPPNAAGWYQSDVTITFTCTDGLSGVNTCPADETLSAEGSAVTSSSFVATDVAGNTSAPSSIVVVNIDRTPPVVSLVGGPGEGASYSIGAVPAAPTCAASDALSGLAADCTISGYETTVGTHTMTAAAGDRAGNHTVTSVTYSVVAQTSTMSGFQHPVDMGSVWNRVKAGATVPLKFQIFNGATELTQTSALLPLSAVLTSCDDEATDDIEVVAAGATTLRYDTAAGHFVYNWKTPNTAGACYVVSVTTTEGATLAARFRLR